jgi:acetyl esterase/lipase
MNRRLLLLLLPAVAFVPAPGRSADNVIKLWPAKAPGETTPLDPERADRDPNKPDVITRVTNVSEPSLTVFPASQDKGTGVGIVIAPGGAYRFLSWAHEGEEIARYFNSVGVTAFVLKYRVPTRASDPANSLALMDGQRAMSLVRAQAKEWGLNPAKIGFLGFSAGGNLAAKVQNTEQPRAYDVSDDIDKVSSLPDFGVLIYPGGILDAKDPSRLGDAYKVTPKTPPTFMAVAGDDTHCAECCLRYALALREAKVKNELHVYASGGHGFGMRPSAGPVSTWPQRCTEWLRSIGMLPKGS